MVNSSNGTIVQELTYDSFGLTLTNTDPTFQPFGFAGGWTDPDTHLIRLGARDYDPATRCWTTADPIYFASGSLNNDAYVRGDPINHVDPSGLNDSIKSTKDQIAYIVYVQGKSPGILLQKPSDVVIIRNGHVLPANDDTALYVGDQIRVSSDSRAGVNFLWGGRINIGANTTVELVNDGQGMIVNPDGSLSPIVVNSGGAWAKFQKQDRPLTIQTVGGAMSIKG